MERLKFVTISLFILLGTLGFFIVPSDDEVVIRRYRVHNIFLSGGSTARQTELYLAYQEALRTKSDKPFQFAFQLCGVGFPKGATAFLSPVDTHLYIRHKTSVINQLETEFSMSGHEIRPDSLLVRTTKKVWEFFQTPNHDDPFAELAN